MSIIIRHIKIAYSQRWAGRFCMKFGTAGRFVAVDLACYFCEVCSRQNSHSRVAYTLSVSLNKCRNEELYLALNQTRAHRVCVQYGNFFRGA
jgi:hypothetical protein